ncbi:MMPL family transporter [Nocardioides taihuensis]|uniref:MMPL family transporter n=1 Tax=Nocardioides taihuensis TaxID=1835606 RepID=A0ABW0BP75_9ACTN
MYAAIGRFTHRHRWTVIAAWAVLLVLGFTIGVSVFGHLSDSGGSGNAESVQGYERLARFQTSQPGIVALVDGAPVDSPAVASAVTETAQALAALPYVAEVRTAYQPGDGMLRGPDGRTSLLTVTVERTEDMMAMHEHVQEVRDTLHGAVPGARVLVGGPDAVMADEMRTSQEDLFRGQLVALPVLLLALLVVFRGFRSAVLPILGALVTVAGALLLLLAATRVVDVAGYAVDVVALFGLGLAVDYSLLMVSRFREEKALRSDTGTTIEHTVGSAGRTITYSAMTVIASLSGLLVFDDPVFRSLAIGGIATVLVALAAGLTLVPALLALWGGRIKAEAPGGVDAGFFARLARLAQRRPAAVAGATTAVLLLAGTPFLGVSYSNGDHRVLPTSLESRQATDLVGQRFPGMTAGPVQVVAGAPASDPSVQRYVAQLRELPDVEGVSVEQLGTGLSLVSVASAGEPQGDEAQRLVEALRTDRPEFETWVTGQAAFLVDARASIADRLPYAVLLIALATFVLLFLMTGSVLVPLKALLMNTLSLGATFGTMVWIFQDGHLSGPLGFTAFGSIELWVPIVVFVFAFGLSMDYEVFLLSRIKEAHDRGLATDAAVVDGLQRSGRIITSAALLVMIAFLGFATGQNLGIKEMGVALTVAVLVDATLVRCLLVPATMTMLGGANWWAPPWLRRVHRRVGLHEAPDVGRPTGAPVKVLV